MRNIQQLNPAANLPGVVSGRGPVTRGGEQGFVKSLTEAAAQVNRLQLDAANSSSQMVGGSASSLHQVVLEAEEASLSLQLMVAVRNKAMDAYQEVMRMQI